MECRILDTNLNEKAIIVDWLSLIWKDCYNDIGSCTLELQYTPELANICKPDYHLTFSESDHVMRIMSVQVELGKKITIYGKDAICWLGERGLVDAGTDMEYHEKEISVRDAVMLVYGLTVWAYPLPLISFKENAIDVKGHYISYDCDNLLEYIMKNFQMYDTGARCTISDKQLVWEIYRPTLNTDKVWSTTSKNILNVSYTQSINNYKNFVDASVYWIKSGDTAQTGVSENVYENGEVSGMDARIIMINENVNDPTMTTEQAHARAKKNALEELYKYAKTESLKFTLIDDSASVGDLGVAQIPELGLDVNLRVQSITWTSQPGTYKRECEIGTPIITKRYS